MNPAVAPFLVTEAQILRQAEREYLPTGIVNFDRSTGGVPRGALTEITGPATSGKTTFLTSFLARSSALGEYCALVDGSDSFDPASASAAGADLERLLWVRCHKVEEALKCADLLIHGGGWGVIALDLSDLPLPALRKIPMSWWYRFRLAVEHTPTALVVMESQPFVKNCAVSALEFPPAPAVWRGTHRHFRLLQGTRIRLKGRKPLSMRETVFDSRLPNDSGPVVQRCALRRSFAPTPAKLSGHRPSAGPSPAPHFAFAPASTELSGHRPSAGPSPALPE